MHRGCGLEIHTWSLVFTTQRGFVAMVVAAPAPQAAIMLAPIESWWFSTTFKKELRKETEYITTKVKAKYGIIKDEMEHGYSLISSIEKATGYKPTIGTKKALELLIDCKVHLQKQ